MEPPTLDGLLKEVDIPLTLLDQKCSDEHLKSISLFLDWRRVAPHLGLDKVHTDEIESKKTEFEKRLDMLQKWKMKYGYTATFKNLVQVLLKVGIADDAEKVCRLLQPQECSVLPCPSPSNNTCISSATPAPLAGQTSAVVGCTEVRVAAKLVSMDLSAVKPKTVQTSLNKYNINITENYGLSNRTGYWWLQFTFDHALEKGIEVRLTNFKYSDRCDWTLEVVKCTYLGIESKEQMASFDMVDEFMNVGELRRLNDSVVSSEKLRYYLESNLVPIVTKKIRYTKFRPQFCFFLSHKSKDKPFMRTFQNGLKFLGYATWLDEVNMPMGSNLQAALKTSIDECDCLIAWLNDEYMQSDYCKAELLYAKQLGKIVLPFGAYSSVSHHFTGELEFLRSQHIYDPAKSSFFEILRRIDDTLFAFEWLAI